MHGLVIDIGRSGLNSVVGPPECFLLIANEVLTFHVSGTIAHLKKF